MMIAIPIGKLAVIPPITYRPEMTIGILGVDGQVRRHMDERGEGEEEHQLAPYFPACCKSNHGQRGIDGNGIKPRDEVLHGGLKIKLAPHFFARNAVDDGLIRRPKINRDIGDE